MNDSSLYTEWYLWLGVAVVIILAAAVLLLLVNAAAKRILNLAQAALGLVIEIKGNTQSIWELQQTNKEASDILEEAQEIDAHISLVADALHELDQKKS